MMHLGTSSESEERITLPPSDLTTHAVVIGRTGSGKTGLMITLLEEIARSGASAVVLDPKGDLTNLALSLTTEEEFRPWASDPCEARLAHGEGLAASDLGFEDVRRWRQSTEVVIYAPGKTYPGGRAVNVFPTFAVPKGNWDRSAISRDVGIVLQSLGEPSDPYDPATVFLTAAVALSWEERKFLPVVLWADVLSNPSEKLQSFGGMPLEEFFPKRLRTKLARKLIGFQHASDRWLSGAPLDLHSLCSGKPKIAVFSLRHLTEDDRQFFAGLLLNKVVDFMYATDASEKLKLALVMDEARGYLPPYPANPPTKAPICTILAQGRAQGIGMIIGTQNPMDLDYKALSNVGTWFVGRLRERDCARDLLTELGNRNVSIETISGLTNRSFLLLDKRGGCHQVKTRWTLNYLAGPLSSEELVRIEGRVQTPVRAYRRQAQTDQMVQPTVCERVTTREPDTCAQPTDTALRPGRAKPSPKRCFSAVEHSDSMSVAGLMVWGLIGYLLYLFLSILFSPPE